MILNDQIPNLEVGGEWFNYVVTTEELRRNNKMTLIYFWALSCDICKKNMPLINDLADSFQDKLNIVGIHSPISPKDYIVEDIKNNVKALKIKHPIFFDVKLRIKEEFEATYIPAYYLFDETGSLRFSQFGSKIKMLNNRINKFIKT